MRTRSLLVVAAIALSVTPVANADPAPVGSAQDRSVEPVVLNGSQFPSWSAGPDPTAREPELPHNYDVADIEEYLPQELRSECYKPGSNEYDPEDNGDHNCYQSSRLPRNPNVGADVGKILGYKWTEAAGFQEIPFQVDERFTRYITNNGSGFAFYSGTDAEETYAWDREGFRFSADESQYVDGGNPCLSMPAPLADGSMGPATTPDPVVGLDDNDELVFMVSDAGAQAPPATPLPSNIESSYEVAVADPSSGAVSYVYVMKATAAGAPSFDANNGYVKYQRDANAEIFQFSESSYDNYGNAPKGPYCTADGVADTSHGAIAQRRPGDGAWVKTSRYAFRYDGRWLMTELHVANNNDGNYGPDIIDQWKARAFQQRPGDPEDPAAGTTPCCGYEEEVNNWGGSSILMGERTGPVRAIRAAWGADSSTNNVKTEVFYRDEIRFQDNLRVHVIPPLDGIYVQWDYNAGAVETYYNPFKPEGVPTDGRNDEVFGNTKVHVAEDRIEVEDEDPIPVIGPQDIVIPGNPDADPNECRIQGDDGATVCNDIDLADPTFSGPAGNLNWEQISGPNGSLVTRWTIRKHTGGDGYSLIAQPYYRDDSCFDDGTGSSPGPHLRSRDTDVGPARANRGETFLGDASTYLDTESGTYKKRMCWQPGDPLGTTEFNRRYVQGDIATHGLHLQLIADSDNAAMTVPLTEIDSEQRMVVLGGEQANVGERYGRHVEFPLQAVARPFV